MESHAVPAEIMLLAKKTSKYDQPLSLNTARFAGFYRSTFQNEQETEYLVGVGLDCRSWTLKCLLFFFRNRNFFMRTGD
jgi:hypothetical protein